MKKLIIIAITTMLCLPVCVWAQNYGQSDTAPSTFVATNGKIQVRYNVKAITITDPGGTSHTAYSYDYATVDKLEKADVDRVLSPAAADSMPAAAVAAVDSMPAAAGNMRLAATAEGTPIQWGASP